MKNIPYVDSLEIYDAIYYKQCHRILHLELYKNNNYIWDLSYIEHFSGTMYHLNLTKTQKGRHWYLHYIDEET